MVHVERSVESIASLKQAPYNPRKISDKAMAGLRASLDRWGIVQDVVVNRRTGHIVGGHQRVAALKAAGVKEAPVCWVDLDETEEKALNVALNNPHIGGEFDDTLQALLAEIKDGIGPEAFEQVGLDGLFDEAPAPVTGEDDPDIEPPADPITKPGDLWVLGDHRLLCGDSTKAEDVARLMGGVKADLCLTDPPYGVSYVGKTKDALKIENDDLDEKDLVSLVLAAFDLVEANSRPGSYWYATVPPGPLHLVFAEDWKRRGILRQIMVWVKDSMVLGHSEYHYQHEPILFGWIPGPRHKNADRTRTTVWNCARPKANREHPTMKPVELWCRAIGDGSRIGEVVIDPFLGSGTTLIAAEQLGRKCYGMEISPAYCDVIVQRWETLTGKKATRDA
jgi:DNA modification methylase